MHKRNYTLTSGECLNDDQYSILTFDVRVEGDELLLLLPEPDELDAVIGTSKWMVRQATAELLEKQAESSIEIVGPGDATGGSCSAGDSKLDW